MAKAFQLRDGWLERGNNSFALQCSCAPGFRTLQETVNFLATATCTQKDLVSACVACTDPYRTYRSVIYWGRDPIYPVLQPATSRGTVSSCRFPLPSLKVKVLFCGGRIILKVGAEDYSTPQALTFSVFISFLNFPNCFQVQRKQETWEILNLFYTFLKKVCPPINKIRCFLAES